MAKFVDFFKVVQPRTGTTTMTDSQNLGDQGVYANYTWYQRLIQGSASRITRYREYDLMDNDVEIARALDTIAEEMTGSNPQLEMPLELNIKTEKQEVIPTSTVSTLRTALSYWCDLHDWETRIFPVARTAIKYGDVFFRRKSDVKKWDYIHPKNVVAAIVDEYDMTRVIGWQIKQDIKVPNSPYNAPVGHFGKYNEAQVDTYAADEIVWFTLNNDLGEQAPFGDSVLRAIYRAQKQKELLEDAIIIYRIQRAPERRVFYIDVGKMPPQRVKTYLEQIKNEIKQKKIPTYGGGVEQVDSVYNPHSMNEDFFFAQRPEGKGSRVEVLPGGQGLGELADLEYFQWKVFRGLRIPLSFMREGQDGAVINDGQVGVAYIQELRFALFVKRLQRYIARVMDKEFKRYLHASGINVDTSIFNLKMPDPENFGIYRQQKLDSELLNTMSSASSITWLSGRFAGKKYLQLTDEEGIENFRQKCEELQIDPNDPASMVRVYGPPPEAGLEAGLGGGGGAPGMFPGTLGGGGIEPGGLGGELGGQPVGGGPEIQNAGGAQPPGNTGQIPPPQ
jgi:hypothetical protein